MGNPFIDGTAVTAVGDGRYIGEIDRSWTLRPLPQGGISTTVALRAIAAELGDPTQPLRTMHTTFAAQVAHGPVEVEVEVLRRGRSVSHLRAEVRNPGQARGHLVTAIHGGSRRGFDFTELAPPPDLRRPAECNSFRDPPPPDWPSFDPLPFWTERVEGRPCLGHPPWEPVEDPRAERAAWYRFDDPPFTADGTLDPASLVVMADSMPGAAFEKIGPDNSVQFRAPSIDLTFHLLDDCRAEWVLAHNTARHAGDGYASADMALWDYGPDLDGSPRLVAYATQLFLFSFMD